jgi:hypothetical protein
MPGHPCFQPLPFCPARERGLGFWREIDISVTPSKPDPSETFRDALCDEHVKRRHNEQSENRSDRHSADEHETDSSFPRGSRRRSRA